MATPKKAPTVKSSAPDATVTRSTWRHRIKEPSTWLGVGSVVALAATQGWAALLNPDFLPLVMTALGLTITKEAS